MQRTSNRLHALGCTHIQSLGNTALLCQNDVMDLARTQRNNRKANAGQANTCLHPGTQTLRPLRWFAVLLGSSQLEFIYSRPCVCIPVVRELLFPLLFLILCPFCIHTFCQLTRGRVYLQALKRPGSAKGLALANGSGWKLLSVLPLPISLRRHCMLSVRASPCSSSGPGNLLVQGQWTMHGASWIQPEARSQLSWAQSGRVIPK